MKYINIIHDSRRMERYDLLVAELERQGISDFEIWPCIMLPNIVESINASHKMIVKKAKDEGLAEVSIWEDDNFFPAADGWKYFLSKKPKWFNLYLAGCYSAIKDGWDEDPYSYTIEPVGFHCYIVHERYYDAFLATPDGLHIDTAQKAIGIKVCRPMAAIQRPGFSINNMKWVDYNLNLRPEDVYGGLP